MGDSGYPLRTYMMIPYDDDLGLHRMFNYRLSSFRSGVERVIGQLKGRFRYLLTPNDDD